MKKMHKENFLCILRKLKTDFLEIFTTVKLCKKFSFYSCISLSLAYRILPFGDLGIESITLIYFGIL